MSAAFDPELTNITLTCPVKQPTADEVLKAMARVMIGQSITRVKFTRLELSHAGVELRPTAQWNEHDELEVRAEG